MKKLILTLLNAAMLAFAAPVQAFEEPIRIGQVGLSFYAVVGGVVQEVLENKGHNVEIIEGPHAQIFPQLGQGKVDLLIAAWLPNGHSGLYQNVEEYVFTLGTLYEDARFFWAVPNYVPVDKISSIEDLKKPDVREKLPSTIVSLPEATGLTQGAMRMMDAYGLKDSGYTLKAGLPAEWFATFTQAVKKNEWVVFPLWQPQWINAAYDIRRLKEPQNAYGDPDKVHIVAHNSIRNKFSQEVLEILANISLTVEDVTEMDRLVNVEGLSPREAAKHWMKDNKSTVKSWNQ